MAKYATATVEKFIEYWEARGVEIPGTWDEPMIEAALLVASEWIDSTYGALFIGEKTGGFLQEREWPRKHAHVVGQNYTFPDDEIPKQIEYAVYEAAYRQASKPGSLLIDYTPGKYKRVSIDGAISVEYAGVNFASDVQATFPRIDQLLSALFDSSADFSMYSGASVRV